MAEFLHGVEVIEVQTGARPIRTVKSSVIGLVGTAPKGPVNTPVLIAGSRREAVRIFGSGFGTILGALEGIFDQIGASVVVVNVLDPSTHKVAVAAKSYTFGEDDTVQLDHRYAASLDVKYGTGTPSTDATEGTDYAFDPDTGILTRLPGGNITANSMVLVAYDRPDETAVMTADVVGGVDAATGAYTGVHALLGAQSEVKVQPKVLCAPGFTSQVTRTLTTITGAPVTSEMVGVAERLSACVVADGPNTNDADAIAYRELFGSRRVFVVDPWLKVWDTEADGEALEGASARVAGVIAKSDNERGFWWSPSNREINGIVGTSRPVEFALGDRNARANHLNENEVATVIQQDGYRLWGNRTCSSDPKWAFLSVVRTADQINESLLRSHLWAVDRNITKTYLEDVVDGVNAYLRELVGLGAILGGLCWVDPELNTPEAIQAGRVYFDFDFTPPTPAEHVTFRSRLVNDYIEIA